MPKPKGRCVKWSKGRTRCLRREKPSRGLGGSGGSIPAYYTVVIPYSDSPHATEWHPTDRTGPFSVLSRGAFKTRKAARAWARKHLGKRPNYSIRRVS